MALLVLLAGAAPAGIVAAGLLLDVARLDLRRRLGGGVRRVATRLDRGAGRQRRPRGGGRERARLVGGGAARVLELPRRARVRARAPGLLRPARAVAALDLNLDVED